MLLHWLDRHHARAECGGLNTQHDRNGCSHGHFDLHPDPVDRYGYCYQYAHLYSHTDKYRNKYTYIDPASYPNILPDVNALNNSIIDSIAHSFIDAESYLYTPEYIYTSKYRDSVAYSVPINDRHPSISEVTDLCFRSLGL